MSTVSASFTAVGLSAELTVKPGQSVSYSASGTFVGTVKLESSKSGFQSVDVVIASATAAASGTYRNESTSDDRLRFRCSAYTSGTIVTSIADADDTVDTLRGSNGAVIATVRDAGIDFPGDITVAGAVSSTSPPLTTSGVGAKAGSTVSVVEQGDGIWHRTIITCDATPVTITDDANVAQYGGAGKIYDFPEGLINIQGAVIDGAVTLGTTGTITNTWAGGVALGTAAATTGATLVSTEADVMPEVDVGAATAKVAVVDAVSVAAVLTESGARWLDGTGTAKDLYLNLVVDDSVTHTSGTGTFTGTITILWTNLGDK